MQQIKSCGVLVVRQQPVKSFLLMKHPQRWDLPKGHLDEGESELQCALRELHEETGISPEQIHIDPDFRFTLMYPVRYKRFGGRPIDKTLVVFLATLVSDVSDVEIQLSEHGDYRWWPWNPPHAIQTATIDPLLAAVEKHWATK